MPDGSQHSPTHAEKQRKALADAVMSVCGLNQPGPRQRAIKRAMVLLWSMADHQTRAGFLERLALPPGYEFLPVTKRWEKMFESQPWLRDPELQDAANHWPYVLKGVSEKDAGFATALSKAIRMSQGPSEKQAQSILRMYRDYRRWADAEGEVVER